MRRIESRLRKLEARLELRNEPQCAGLAFVWHFLPLERKNNLGPGERVVVDWFRNSNSITQGRERITVDAADNGRKCKRDGYLLDVVAEIHQSCSHRESTGSCLTCRDTTVAEASSHSLLNSKELDNQKG
jgi:hypothetical protein